MPNQSDWHSCVPKKLKCMAWQKSTVLDQGFLKQMTVLTNKSMVRY